MLPNLLAAGHSTLGFQLLQPRLEFPRSPGWYLLRKERIAFSVFSGVA
jgi:hypothetical protein